MDVLLVVALVLIILFLAGGYWIAHWIFIIAVIVLILYLLSYFARGPRV